MDFFAAQAAARRRRRWLSAAFGSVVLGVGVLLPAAVATVAPSEWTPLLWAVGALWAGSMLVPAWSTAASLDAGGGTVAQLLGAHALQPPFADLGRQRLYNIIEEMAIASGMTVPDVFVLSEDDSINAMAAGKDVTDAAIVVTRGAVERLDREQLQALVAHEFSHIQNGDMATNTQMIAWIAGLAGLSQMGAKLAEFSGRVRSREAGQLLAPVLLTALAMAVVGAVGRFFATLLQAAACRQHERLADASAVQFTRNPDALKRLLLAAAGGAPEHRTDGGGTRAMFAHLWFLSAGSRWLRTHPTIEERIRAVDPRFRVEVLQTEAERAWQAGERRRLAAMMPRGAEDAGQTARSTAVMLETLPYLALAATPDFVVGKVGHPAPAELARGEALRVALPEPVARCAASASLARALTCAVLASGDEARWSRQMDVLARELGEAVRVEAASLRTVADSLDLYLRLPAIEAVFPGLRRLSTAEQHGLLTALEAMGREDGRVELFEVCLNLLVRHGLLDEQLGRSMVGRGSLWHSGEAMRTLLSIVAVHGAQGDEAAQQAAYRAGMDCLAGAAAPALASPPNWSVALDAALGRLAALDPIAKRRVVAALTATVAHDGRLTLAEAELLRTLCAILRCPLPPLIPEVVAAPPDAPAAPPSPPAT